MKGGKYMKKRILALLVTAALILSMIPMAFAADIASGTCGDNLTWTLSDTGVLTISGSGAMSDFTPSGAPWYSNRTSITTLVIGEGVTSVGDYAFRRCSSLTSATFPSTLTSIGECAFEMCKSMANVTLPANLRTIEASAFSECEAFTTIVIPEGITTLGNHAFSGCANVTDVTLPSTMTSIGVGAFYSCLSLYNINIPENVVTIDDWAFYTCKALTGIALPEGATTIGVEAFKYCTALESVYIPASVNSIDANAFDYCDTSILAFYGAHDSYAETYANEKGITYNPMHSYDQVVVTEPTCTESGYTTHTCSCGEDFISDLTDALGHDYVNGACTRCGETYLPDLSGDVNRDGKVNVSDIMRAKALIKQGSATAEDLAYGDVNGDGELDSADLAGIKTIILAG